jgi:hypothetical protein
MVGINVIAKVHGRRARSDYVRFFPKEVPPTRSISCGDNPPPRRPHHGSEGHDMRAFKILGEITRPLIELDHRWRTESLDNDGGRHPRVRDAI